MPATVLDPFLPQDEAIWQDIRSQDEALLAELAELNSQSPSVYSMEAGMNFANGELAGLARRRYDAESLAQLEQHLTDRKTLSIPIVEGYTVTIDGVERDLALVAATETSADGANHGEMSSMLYLRDQIQTASAMMELSLGDPGKYEADAKLGKQLLISALHLMSTPSQLERFDDVIERGPEAGQADWPQISLYFDDLEGTKPNGWRNKQDSFQMLAHLTLDAIDRGFLEVDELADSHKQFLSSIVPFLKSVGFPRYESSGSWEEVEAVRTSVMAVETALLHKMQALTTRGQLDFLKERYEATGTDFDQTLDGMLQEGLHELGDRLPFESPDYAPESVKYREGDAALVYLLRYDLPRLLADNNIPIGINDGQPMSAQEIEYAVLVELFKLIDTDTNGMIRYEDDSYQGINFHTNEVQLIVRGIKRKVQHDAEQNDGVVNLDEKQSLRGKLTPKGKPPAWTHPLGQLGSWAAKRSRAERFEGNADGAAWYAELSTFCLNSALSTVTGENQWHAVLDENGRYIIRQVPRDKQPECIVANKPRRGTIFHTPSSHTPLNWATAMLKENVGMLGMCLK